jgi:hypothetical protein
MLLKFYAMNKILPIYFVIMFFSLATFGQNKFYFKSLPDSSGLFKRKPINPAIRISGPNRFYFKSFPDSSSLFKRKQINQAFRISPDIRIARPIMSPSDSLISDNNLSFDSEQLSAINRFRSQPDPKVRTGILQDDSNMPIADLSIGYSSNLPIKEFPKDFPSNMPIVEGNSAVPEAFFRGLNEGKVIIVE